MSYWTYIVASKSGTLYVGMTNNIELRMIEHKQHLVEGFTKKYACTRLVWYAKHQYVRTAIGQEKQIKGWTRAKKEALIRSENPHWDDLAEHWGAAMLFPQQSIRDQKA